MQQELQTSEGTAGELTLLETSAAAEEKSPNNRRKGDLRKIENLYGWLYISPMIVGILLFTAIPLVMSVMAMFYDWSGSETLFESEFIGWKNFEYIFGGIDAADYWGSMANTLIFVVQLPVGMVLGILLAVGMNRNMRGVQTFRVIYYLPGVMSVVAVSIIWQNLFKADGTINNLIYNMGGERIGWLTTQGGVAFVVNLLLVWKGVGYTALMFIAGLQSVSTDQIEAAKIDGANGWTILMKITMPALYPIIFYLFVTGLMGALQMFNEPYILLGDGDKNGMTAVGYVYNRFNAHRLGVASVGAWTLAFFIFIVTAVQMYFDKKKQEAD